jgi:hypothetical protein
MSLVGILRYCLRLPASLIGKLFAFPALSSPFYSVQSLPILTRLVNCRPQRLLMAWLCTEPAWLGHGVLQ